MIYPDGYDPLYPVREIIFRAWSDSTFKERLLSEPLQVMREYNAKIPENITEIRVVENTQNQAYFILPLQPPSSFDYDDDAINETIDSMLLTQFVFPGVLSTE